MFQAGKWVLVQAFARGRDDASKGGDMAHVPAGAVLETRPADGCSAAYSSILACSHPFSRPGERAKAGGGLRSNVPSYAASRGLAKANLAVLPAIETHWVTWLIPFVD